MAATPSSGSITSPLPLTRYVLLVSATSSSASRCRSTRSVRHSLASSTTERGRLPLNCSSFCFEAREEREGVGGGAGKSRQNLVVVKAPELARRRL